MKTSSELSAPRTSGKIFPKKVVLELDAYGAPEEGRLNSVRLDLNESTTPIANSYPIGLPGAWVSAYPEYGILVGKLSKQLGLTEESILLTNGSDEAISLVANTFVEPGGDSAIVSKPCFIMIPQCLKLAGANLVEIPVLADLSFDCVSIEKSLARKPRIAMFASPENPTGSIIPVDLIDSWCSTYSETLFVIDEAYGEFVGESAVPLIAKYDNLLVLKTFSKAWGMAGLRLGMILGSPELIQYVQRVQLPYSVNSAAVYTALQLLDCESEMQARVAEILSGRSQLAAHLANAGYLVRETRANWCLLGAGMLAEKLSEYCRDRNILLRNRSNSIFPSAMVEPMWGWVRVSIGNKEEMSLFQSAIEDFGKSFAIIFDLDGTLVDTSKSFDETIAFLVNKYSGSALSVAELSALRREGGFNDDWVATQELLKRRGVDLDLDAIAREGTPYYLAIARTRETLLVDKSILQALRRKHRIFVVTGRTSEEYEPVWGKELNPLFDAVYCLNDAPGLKAKPSPDYLLKALADSGSSQGVYIGNSVDDMQAAKAAKLFAVGIAEDDDARALLDAGAETILPSCANITELFMLPTK